MTKMKPYQVSLKLPYDQEKQEKGKERRRKYRQENREKIKERGRKYYLENREKIRECGRKYRLENKEKERERRGKYRLENKEKIKEKNRKYWLENQKERIRDGAWCQFDGCDVDNFYMLLKHHLFPGDKKTTVVLCANHHLLIDHYKEGFFDNGKEHEKTDLA